MAVHSCICDGGAVQVAQLKYTLLSIHMPLEGGRARNPAGIASSASHVGPAYPRGHT